MVNFKKLLQLFFKINLKLDVGDMLVGGNDTQSVTLAWNIVIMCNHPEIQQKVAYEIDQFVELNDRTPTFKERDQMPYCVAVMKESIRFRTTTSFGLAHTSKNDCKFSIANPSSNIY